MRRSVIAILAMLAFAFIVSVCSKLPVGSNPFSIVLNAQTVPHQATFLWNPNPAGDNVTDYQVVLDGGAPQTVLPSACTGTPVVCSVPVTLTTFGAHTASVAARNLSMSGDPGVTGTPQSSPASVLNLVLNQAPSKPTGAAAK